MLSLEEVVQSAQQADGRPPSLSSVRSSNSIVLSGCGNDSIEIIDVRSGIAATLAHGLRVVVSENGRFITYLSYQADRSSLDLCLTDLDTRATLTTKTLSRNGGRDFTKCSWSPDCDVLAYTVMKKGGPSRGCGDAVSAQIYQEGGGDTTEFRLFGVCDGGDRGVAQVPNAAAQVEWLDKDALLAVVVTSQRNGSPTQQTRFVKIDLRDGLTSDLMPGQPHRFTRWSLSPDKQTLAVVGDAGGDGYFPNRRIGLIGLKEGKLRWLETGATSDLPTWHSDSKSLYFATGSETSQVSQASLNGEITALASENQRVVALCLCCDGDAICLCMERDGRRQLVALDSTGKMRKIVREWTVRRAPSEHPASRKIHWTSDDGLTLAGYLITPPQLEPGRRYPLLVNLAGAFSRVNPSMVLPGGPAACQYFAEKGYAIFIADYRGAGAYGVDKMLSGRNDGRFLERDMTDIMMGIDQVIAEGIIDDDRVGIVGHSLGGTEVDWLITHTNRFRCAVSYEGFADMCLMWGTREGPNYGIEQILGGNPLGRRDLYEKQSPVRYAEHVVTPTLFVHGEFGDSSASHEFMYSALCRKGVDSMLIIYRDEGHVIAQPANQLDFLERVSGWLVKHGV